MSEHNIPEKYQPLRPAQYFWLTVLFAIPVIGFICLIIMSISNSNINRRNFARSYWVPLVIIAIMAAIVFISGGITTVFDYLKSLIG